VVDAADNVRRDKVASSDASASQLRPKQGCRSCQCLAVEAEARLQIQPNQLDDRKQGHGAEWCAPLDRALVTLVTRLQPPRRMNATLPYTSGLMNAAYA